METKFNINGRELVRETKEDRIIVSDICFSCHQKGIVAVKLVMNNMTSELVRSACKINICKNPECFRYSERVPNTWMDEKKAVNSLHESRN